MTTAANAPAARWAGPSAWARVPAGAWIAGALALGFLLLFLVLPVGRVFVTAFQDADGGFTLGHFGAFFDQGLMRESFFNSLFVAGMSALFAALIAVPLAYLTVRFEFRGAVLVQTLGVLPLIMPPFVGAAAMQLIFGRSGSVNLLLGDAFGFTLPIMDGLAGVIFVESIHYFPFILLNLTVALRNIDGAMEEAALNLGCTGGRLFRRVIFPLAAPGFVAGASLVFVKVFDDLGTPLVLGQTNLLAPQAYLRITQVGLEDPLGYVISVLMIGFSILAMALSARMLAGPRLLDAPEGRRAASQRRELSPWASLAAYGWIVLVLLLVLSPAHRRAAAVVRESLELLAAARCLHARALRDRVRDHQRHDRQHAVVLRARGRARCAARRGDCLPDAAQHAAGREVARLDRERLARGAGHRAGDRLPAAVQGRDAGPAPIRS